MQLSALPFWSPSEVNEAITAVIQHLRAGKILGYPTETIYGFGGAVDQAAVERLVQLKGRPPAKPFLLLVAGSEMLDRLDLHLTPGAAALAARHWPGPLTLVLPGGERRVPRAPARTGGRGRRALDLTSGTAAAPGGVRRSHHVDVCQPSRAYRQRCRRPRLSDSGAMRSPRGCSSCSTADG